MSTKVRVLVELDQALLTQVDQLRGEVELSRMLGVMVRLGFNMMTLLAKHQGRATTT
jgi:hypothetical protein